MSSLADTTVLRVLLIFQVFSIHYVFLFYKKVGKCEKDVRVRDNEKSGCAENTEGHGECTIVRNVWVNVRKES